MKPKRFNFKQIERKWQKAWAEANVFEAQERDQKPKFYCLEMFPYPSASFLHMGHVRNYAIGDLIARYKRMKGFNVLYPMGFDAFGLPAENAAIKEKVHPKKYTEDSIKVIRRLMQELGLSYDWKRMIATCYPEYYKWNQWIFLRMLEKGIAYRKKAPVNWCPSCNTVLANEEASSGRCWRCNSEVTIKQLDQWFLNITRYADELLEGLDHVSWPERTKEIQRNWIGRSKGTKVIFPVKGFGKSLEVFTTRPDTIYGVSFLACAVRNPFVAELVAGTSYEKKYRAFLEKVSASEKLDVQKEKEGFFTGRYAVHPLTGKDVPIFAGTFVVADYGTGTVMGVPAHDERDFAFAKKHKLEIRQVIAPLFVTTEGKDAVKNDKPHEVRDSVFAIVKHWRENKYFCLDWKKFGWKSFVIGGVEEGESAEQAALREVKEETGYHDIKSITPVGPENHSNYYAEHKGVNRYGKYKTFLIKLGSGKRNQLDPSETKNHEGLWVDEKEVSSFINLSNNKYVWEVYTGGEHAFTGTGKLINSDEFSGLASEDAKLMITKVLERKSLGGPSVEYRLRDWLISRQRYWGTPIPIVYCDDCGVVPVQDKDLPVLLPEKVTFSGKGNPLQTSKSFVNTTCPSCGGKARRETDTMGTFFDSSWYFLRYCSPQSHDVFDRKSVSYWMPVDQYVGGIEHAATHLLYARFFTKFFRDLGWIVFDEPFMNLFNQGVVHKGGKRMSKSQGNAITAEEISERYGIDAARLFLLFVASPEKDMEWDDHGIEGASRLVAKFIDLFSKVGGTSNPLLDHKLNTALRAVEQSYEKFEFNKGIIAFMDLVQFVSQMEKVPRAVLETMLLMISPVMPHLAEEFWHALGRASFIVQETWPHPDESKIDARLEEREALMDKTVQDVLNIIKLLKDKKQNVARVYLYTIPPEVKNYDSSVLERRLGVPVAVFAVNDSKKYDPQSKAGKAKPGRPAVYVE